MPPVEKSVESFGFKIVNWNVDGDDLGGDKDQTGDNQPIRIQFSLETILSWKLMLVCWTFLFWKLLKLYIYVSLSFWGKNLGNTHIVA